jgi:hypothetical protein
LEKDLRELKFKIWRQKAFDREEWAYIFKEAKAVRGRKSGGVSRLVSLFITII